MILSCYVELDSNAMIDIFSESFLKIILLKGRDQAAARDEAEAGGAGGKRGGGPGHRRRRRPGCPSAR